jgi:hypothetical protein
MFARALNGGIIDAAATIAHDWLCLLALKKGAKFNVVGRI